MRAERERRNAQVTAETLRLKGERLDWTDDAQICRILLLSGGSCTLQWCGEEALVTPGCAVILGPGSGFLQPSGQTAPELQVCGFPLELLRELRTVLPQEHPDLFAPESRRTLYAPVRWLNRLRTVLELMRQAAGEDDYPGVLYLMLVLHYVEQEYNAESETAARPYNETVSQVCAYLASNYQQKFSLGAVAAQFYLSPYYLSRLFRRVTGRSIVDYINGRRIEAARQLLETTDLSISDVAEQTGFASAAHFRRVFREALGVRPLQYRKEHRK